MAHREHGPVAAQPARNRRRQSLRAETILRTEAARHHAAAHLPHTYQGPQFGIAGTRTFTGVQGRPIIGTIIKPSVGMSPEATAAQVKTLVEAGIDFIKDDELQSDGPHCPFDERVAAVMNVINRHADATGKRVMYAANITGDLDEMLRRHDTVVEHRRHLRHGQHELHRPAGNEGAARTLSGRHPRPPQWLGMFGRSPAIGMSFVAFQKLWRIAGIDHTHVNGLSNKFCEPDDSVIASARACLTPMFDPPAARLRDHAGLLVRPIG